MNTNTKTTKIIIINNTESNNRWLEEPLREEYYRSELDTLAYLNSKASEYEDKDLFDSFVNSYLDRNGKTSGDITVFIKELRSFLKSHKENSIKNDRVG